MVKFVAVPDSESIVNREHHKSHVGQSLILGVLVRVVVGVVPAQQHLTRRTTVDENHRGFLRGSACFLEELAVDGQSVAGVEDNFARSYQARSWKVRWNSVDSDPFRRP